MEDFYCFKNVWNFDEVEQFKDVSNGQKLKFLDEVCGIAKCATNSIQKMKL